MILVGCIWNLLLLRTTSPWHLYHTLPIHPLTLPSTHPSIHPLITHLPTTYVMHRYVISRIRRYWWQISPCHYFHTLISYPLLVTSINTSSHNTPFIIGRYVIFGIRRDWRQIRHRRDGRSGWRRGRHHRGQKQPTSVSGGTIEVSSEESYICISLIYISNIHALITYIHECCFTSLLMSCML